MIAALEWLNALRLACSPLQEDYIATLCQGVC